MTQPPADAVQRRILNWGGYRLLSITPETRSQAQALLERGDIQGVHVSAWFGAGQAELDEFATLPGVQGLAIQGLEDIDYTQVYGNALRLLELVDEVPWPDFSCFPQLSRFAADAKKRDVARLPATLTSLALSHYRGVDLASLAHLVELGSLDLNYPGKLVSLHGLPASVESLGLGNASKLADIEAIRNCNLVRMTLDACRSIRSLDALGTQPRLERLMLSKLGEVESIACLAQCPRLEFLSLPGTRIVDGDLRCCHAIGYVHFEPQPHYSHRPADFRNRGGGR